MQTPSHVIISLFFWRHRETWRTTAAVVCGAFLPDITMFIFYAYQKAIGTSEQEIWQTCYFLNSWQLFFDLFNSIPIYLCCAVFFCCFRRHWLAIVSASALIHVLCDLPLHNDDAHRHFLPISHWRFISPVSYWDPKHFGIYAMLAEVALVVSLSVHNITTKKPKPIRCVSWTVLMMYLTLIAIGALVMIQGGLSIADV